MKRVTEEFKDKNVNERWLVRYIKFISKFSVKEDYEGYKEKHHILPSSIFPNKKNLRKFEWNGALLSGKGHFIAHFILCKLFNDMDEKNKMLFAFNNMKRINNTGSLYNSLKEESSKAISMANKGRIVYHNPSTNKEIRLRFDDKVPDGYIKGCSDLTISTRMKFQRENIMVKDECGNIFYVSRDDYISRENLVPQAQGRKHSEETKKKISENGIKNRKLYNNGIEKIYLKDDEKIPVGFVPGDLQENKDCLSKTISELKSYHNTITGESIRIKGEPPEGFIKGRGTFNNIGTKGKTPYTNGHENRFFSPEDKIPPGFWRGNKSMKMFNIYDDKGTLIETIGRIQAKEKYSITIIGASKERPIGYNKSYLSRLSHLAKEHIGWYSIMITMEEYLSKNKL